MTRKTKHLLRVYAADGIRTIRLHQACYSLGRDKHNDIVLFSKTVSRCHAHLMRISTNASKEEYYRILDGDTAGKLSTNGITVNDHNCKAHDLINGDNIMIGNVKISYWIEKVETPRQTKLFETVNFQQIEDLTPVLNPKSTFVDQPIPGNSSKSEIQEDWEDDLPPTALFRQS